ncbi:MAG: endoglucanase [Methermicoccus sp.]|nr:endoglucanase [Methermicoccus sp.]
MKKNRFILLLSIWCLHAYAQNANIRFNSLGFVPQQKKEATLIKKCDSFVVKDAVTHKIVFEGRTHGPIFQQDVNQQAWIADFSAFNTSGNYYIELPDGEKSAVFPVNENVYNIYGDVALMFMESIMEKCFRMLHAIWMMGMMIILATRDLNVTGQAAGTMQVITANML